MTYYDGLLDTLDRRLSFSCRSDPELLAIQAMRLVHSHVTPLEAAAYEPKPIEQALLDGNGQCGHQSQILADLLRMRGLRARQVGFRFDPPLPWTNGAGHPLETHVGVEVAYDGHWHYFDPHYGTYWRGRGGVMALERLLAVQPATRRRRAVSDRTYLELTDARAIEYLDHPADRWQVEEEDYPADLLAGADSVLLLFAAGFGGRNDGQWVRDAGVPAVTAVDLDGDALRTMRDSFPSEWEFVCEDAFEFARSEERTWDIVSVDLPSSMPLEMADVAAWCRLANRHVVSTVMRHNFPWQVGISQLPPPPQGWSYRRLHHRSSYRGGCWWLVTSREEAAA